jgi:hypothetical protein
MGKRGALWTKPPLPWSLRNSLALVRMGTIRTMPNCHLLLCVIDGVQGVLHSGANW